MKTLYAMYARLVIALLGVSHSDVFGINVALRIFAVVWGISLLFVLLNLRWANWIALAAFAPLVAVLLGQFARRISFIAEYHGFDCATATCQGSPVAFLLGWAGELFLFIPGVVLCIWLVRQPDKNSHSRLTRIFRY